MANSFFTGTLTQLYNGSNAFASKISTGYATYGIPEASAQAYVAQNAVYAACYAAAEDPETRTKAKIRARRDAADLLREMASKLAKLIDGTPTVTNEQKLELGLNVRKTPAPLPPPGQPRDFKVILAANGTLTLGWRCDNPPGGGVVYHVFRASQPQGPFEFVGGSTRRSFIDATVSASTPNVVYQIQGVRASGIGPVAQFNVNFGMSNTGQMTATVESAPKLAA